MAYADAQSLRQRTAGMAGVVAVHAGMATLVMVGLTVTVIDPEPDDPTIDTFEVREQIPPPPPKPETKPEPAMSDPIVFAPKPIIPDLTPDRPLFPVIDEMPMPGPIIRDIPPLPDPTPSFSAIQPVAAIPRNDPGRWIMDSDYRTRWIREGKFGRANFTLEVGTNGRVTQCSVTRSTGHAVLDEATCQLITKRARFKPAKNSEGATTTGIYSSSIRWQLPD